MSNLDRSLSLGRNTVSKWEQEKDESLSKSRRQGRKETEVNGLTLIRCADDTTSELEHCSRQWDKTKGQVANLPVGIRRY